jgi:hypothetical protein
MPKAEESLCGNKKIYILIERSPHLFTHSAALWELRVNSEREHGLITLVPAQWELIFYNCDGLHILQDWHP